jgi:hypothetical protein
LVFSHHCGDNIAGIAEEGGALKMLHSETARIVVGQGDRLAEKRRIISEGEFAEIVSQDVRRKPQMRRRLAGML